MRWPGYPEMLNNLPTPVSSFIGRAAELAEVRRLLGGSRLVTLTGAGGAGKTRLGPALDPISRRVALGLC